MKEKLKTVAVMAIGGICGGLLFVATLAVIFP